VRSSFSPPDPYILQSLGSGFDETYDYSGRTQINPSLVGGEHTTVILFFGDSLGASTDNSSYSPTNSTKVQDFSLQNGGVYQAKTPALSCTNEGDPANNGFWGHRLGDKLINNSKTARVITFSIAIGSTGTALWATSPYLNRFTVAYRRLNSLGLLSANRVFILSSIGGLDQTQALGSATVKTNLDTIIAGIRSAGFSSAPVYLALSSWAGGGTGGANGTNVRTGITNAISGNANTFTGADTDTIVIGSRYDTNHYNSTGSDSAATLWYNVISGVFP
jgi:hypothetical protein